jgi:hypothetical protein
MVEKPSVSSTREGPSASQQAEQAGQRDSHASASATPDTVPADECPYCGCFVGMEAHYDGAVRDRGRIPTDEPLIEGRYSKRTCHTRSALGKPLGCGRTFYVYSAILD